VFVLNVVIARGVTGVTRRTGDGRL